ncbi:hypothetical protein AAFN88_12775 [Pelagibius sp. CAU 1746]|uniref:hypothetical protein n=1 Tax=Pelagibius sp. CAU 1746 TaxID=3140370 RepID=UPI00325AF95A
MTDDASPEAAGDAAGGPPVPARAEPAFTLRNVPPPTAEERRAQRAAMERAIEFGAAPYRDAEGRARYVVFKDANNAPVEAWTRDREAKRGYRRTQYARKAAGQMAWHPEDQIELAKRLGVIYHREGRSVEGAAERGLYDAIWRYEHVWDSFTVPRRIGGGSATQIIDTGRIAAVAEEEARRLQAEDPRAAGGFWVRDRKNRGLIYVVPNPDTGEGADARPTERAAAPVGDILKGESGEITLPGQADAVSEPGSRADEAVQDLSEQQGEVTVKQPRQQSLHYPDIPLPPPAKTWKIGKEVPLDEDQLPVINMEQDRIRNILANEPAKFDMVNSQSAKRPYKSYERNDYGYYAVWIHQDAIEYQAARQGVDPNLVKAIVYFENARGWYGNPLDYIRVSSSALPMNIKSGVWGGLVGEGKDFYDPLVNIEAGVRLIRRIIERLQTPTVAGVGSIYNFTGQEIVVDNGATVAEIYKTQPWKRRPKDFPSGLEMYMTQRRDALKQRLPVY